MMTEEDGGLVERLRRTVCHGSLRCERLGVDDQAAERIEALIAENERLEALFTNSTYEAKAMMEEIDRRGAEIQALREMQGKGSHDR
jgi:hypothetical protein